MASTTIPILFYSTVAGVATLLGILMMEKKQQWAIEYSHYVNSFAAGLILSVAFFQLGPEASELTEIDEAFFAVFLGFFVFYILENLLVLHSGAEMHYCVDDEGSHSNHLSQTGWMVFSGLAFHSLIDGIFIGVGFEVSSNVGLLAATAVILHEVPEGVTSFAILRESMELRQARLLAIIVAIATPLGAVLSVLFIGSLNETTIGMILAIAAGTFIYVASADLIPETHESEGKVVNLIAFLIGAILIYSLGIFLTD
ncbi:MAG: ZIP family metal transporter [Promethearchaeota archaeon]